MAKGKLKGAGKGAELKAAVAPKKKSATDTGPSRQERADALIASFNKSMRGRAQIKKASEYSLPYMTRRLPTGLLTLDLELRGGFPGGGLSEIVGPKNSGKSWLTWQVIRQLQTVLGDKLMVLLAMTEMRADRGQARLAGVQIAYSEEDIAEFEKGRIASGQGPFTAEERANLRHEVGTIHELHGESAEDLYDGVIAAVEGGVYHVIVIDSFGSIMSGAEAESDSLSDKQYGGAAAVNTKFLRKLSALLTMDDAYGKARDVCILGINQVRDAIGDPNKEFKSTGGRALEHAKFVSISVTSGRADGYEDMMYTSNGTKKRFIQTGKEVNWKIEKGKAGIHEGGRGSYVYDFRVNTANFYLDTVVAGIQTGVLEQAGAWIGLRDPENPAQYLCRANGKDDFIQMLSADAAAKAALGDADSFMNIIREEAFKKAGINVSYDWE